MWVLLRLLTAVCFGVVKFLNRKIRFAKSAQTGTVSWVYTQTKNKRQVVGVRFGVRFAHPIFFRLSRESRFDRFFKTTGFSVETQTGDRAFDDLVYVACDHPALAPLLRTKPTLRSAITHLLTQADGKKIHADGAHLWVERDGDQMPTEEDTRQLMTIRDALARVPANGLYALRDPFFRRALLVEAMVYAVAAYSLPGLFEKILRPHPLYFNWAMVILVGLLAAMVIYALLFSLARAILRGSSRAHRVLIESAVVLALCVPPAAVDIVSDLNTALDTSEPMLIQRKLEKKYIRTTTRRGIRFFRPKEEPIRDYHRLQFVFVTSTNNPTLEDIEVSAAIYHSVQEGKPITIRMRKGALALPWVEDISGTAAPAPVERAK